MTKRKLPKIIYFLVCFLLIFQQSGFAQVAGSTTLTTSAEINIAGHLSALHSALTIDKFRPLHLRYLQYLPNDNSFKLLLDKGDYSKGLSPSKLTDATLKGTVPEEILKSSTKELLKYFFIGLTLPNDAFWVNLRPDAEDNIIDDYLAKTDVGKIMLEADLQLKKDTALATSPQTPEGKEYWNKLYSKAGELFGSENITIPTLTRPWIVPDEIIIRETTDSAYIYKATLKVMLESDYLKAETPTVGDTFRQGYQGNLQRKVSPGMSAYEFKDERSKALNEYSSELIRELIIPKLTKEINTSRRYASLRQVYYSLILAQWFKARHKGLSPKGTVPDLINSRDLTNLISKEDWSKTTYFQAYQKSFKDGEYNIQEPVYTPTGQVIRSYFSGGISGIAPSIPSFGATTFIDPDTSANVMVEPAAHDFNASNSPILAEMSFQATDNFAEAEPIPITPIIAIPAAGSPLKEKINKMISETRAVGIDVDSSPELKDTAKKFESIYQKLEEAAEIIVLHYQELAEKYGLNPGQIRLYMFGGRVKGKPLAVDSDIDLVFAVENMKDSFETLHFNLTDDPVGLKLDLYQKVKKNVNEVCIELNIPNKFHILNIGTLIPKDDLVVTDERLLLANKKSAGSPLQKKTASSAVEKEKQSASSAVMLDYFKQQLALRSFTINNIESIHPHPVANAIFSDKTQWFLYRFTKLDPRTDAKYLDLFIKDNDIVGYGIITLMAGNAILRFQSFEHNKGQAELWAKIYQERLTKLKETFSSLNKTAQFYGVPTDQILSEAQIFRRIKSALQSSNTDEKEILDTTIAVIDKIRKGIPLSPQEISLVTFQDFDGFDSFGLAANFYVTKLGFDIVPTAVATHKARISQYEQELLNNLNQGGRLTEAQIIDLFSGRALIKTASSAINNAKNLPDLADGSSKFFEGSEAIRAFGDILGQATFDRSIGLPGDREQIRNDIKAISKIILDETDKLLAKGLVQWKLLTDASTLVKGDIVRYTWKNGEKKIVRYSHSVPQESYNMRTGEKKTIGAFYYYTYLESEGYSEFDAGDIKEGKVEVLVSSERNISLTGVRFGTKDDIYRLIRDGRAGWVPLEDVSQLRNGDIILDTLPGGDQFYRFEETMQSALKSLYGYDSEDNGELIVFDMELGFERTIIINKTKKFQYLVRNVTGNQRLLPDTTEALPRPHRSNEEPGSKVSSAVEKAKEYTEQFVGRFGAPEAIFGGVKELNNLKARAEIIGKEIYINSLWINKMTKDEMERVIAHEAQHTRTDFLRDEKGLKIGGLHRVEPFQDLQQRIGELYDKTIQEKGNVFAKPRSQYQENWEVLSLLRGYQIYREQLERGLQVIIQPYEFIEAFIPKDLAFLNEDYLFEITKDFEPEVGQGTKISYTELGYPEKEPVIDSDIKSVASSTISDKGGIDGSIPLTINAQESRNTGGIDFRALPIVTQAMSNLSASLRDSPLRGQSLQLEGIDLGQKLEEIQKMVDAGLTPSTDRIKEYVQASCLKGNSDMQKVVSCIADILRLEEERCCSTEAMLKDILVVLESGRSNQELKAVFTGANS